MSLRTRGKPGLPTSAEGRAGCATAAAVLSGLVLAVLALFLGGLTSRVVLLWLQRGDYIRTELNVTEIAHGDGAVVYGIVAATGEEVHCTRMPAELREFVASDPNSTVTTFVKVD